MQILLSCSKNMTADIDMSIIPFTSHPTNEKEASQIAFYMAQRSVRDLEDILRVNSKLALENQERYQVFHAEETKQYPALFAYSGIVFKHIDAVNFSKEEFEFAQSHLRLTSFLYGLLRPLDLIKLYRMEGNVVLTELGGESMFAYWKKILTSQFIDDIAKGGNILFNLASGEMKNLFNWKEVKKSADRIITPEFKVWKDGKYKTIVVYTKMCRGEMTKYIIKNKIEDPEELKAFEWEGFKFNDILSKGDNWVFTLD